MSIDRRPYYWGAAGGALFTFAACLGGTYLLNQLGLIFVPAEGSDTPTTTPTGTPLPTETPLSIQSETPIPTETLSPTATQTSLPTATPLTEVYSYNQKWTGELPFSNSKTVYGDDVINAIMSGLVQRYGTVPSGVDSTGSSLGNPFSEELFGKDPSTEPGFGHTAGDMAGHVDIRNVVSNRSEVPLSQLLRLNSNGLYAMEITGWEHDRDAALAILATAQAFASGRLEGFTGTNTLQEVFNDPNAVATIDKIQDDMFEMIQEKHLETSEDELDRRNLDGGAGDVDASAGIPPELNVPDQSVSCDVYRTSGDERVDQSQATREVVHEVGEEDTLDTFTTANTKKEQNLWVWSYDPATGKYKVGSFNTRSYPGEVLGQEFSPSGEQELPCDEGEANVPVATMPIQIDNPTPFIIYSTPTFVYPTAVPTNPDRDEPNPEQTDVPDRLTATPIP